MIQNIFERIEQKYLLSEEQYICLNNLISKYFEKDNFFESHIYNIYFDNDNRDLTINSLEKPLYKEKIRARSYFAPKENDVIFFEIKQKFRGTVYKRRVKLTLKEYNDYLKSNIFPENNRQIMKEIDYYIHHYKLKPFMLVAYDRLSYYSKSDKNFRLTFDTNLRSRQNNLTLSDSNDDSFYFDKPTYIMEVKCLGSLPLWFTKVLSKYQIYPSSFSKIGNIYKKERGIIC